MSDTNYIRYDEHGVKRVGGTRVMLDSIVAAFHQGHSPETISQQYPSLSLGEIYGAITDYLAHKEEMDQYLQSQAEVWKSARAFAQQSTNEVVARFRRQSCQIATDSK